MKRLRRWLWLLPLLVALVVAWLVASLPDRPYQTAFTGAAKDTGTGGGAGLLRWLPRVGFAPTLLDVPAPRALERLTSQTGNCLLSLGDDWGRDTDPTSEEWSALRRWIERGNSFFVVAGEAATLPQGLFDQLLRLDRKTLSVPGAGSAAEREPVTLRLPGQGPQAAAGAVPMTLNGKASRWMGIPAQWAVAGDDRGTFYHRIGIGKGAVVILLDDFAFSNDGLDAAGNPAAVQRLLRRELDGGALLIDEARHHSQRTHSYLVALARLPGAPRLLLLGGLLAVLFLFAANVRLGRAVPFVFPERRSAREYIEAMAGIHERARSAPLMVELVAARTAQLARRRGPGAQSALAGPSAWAARHAEEGGRPKVPQEAMEIIAALLAARRAVLGSQRAES